MSSAPLYPVFLNLHKRDVLIVGGGNVALRKTAALLASGALVTVISPKFRPELLTLNIRRIERPYAYGDMKSKKWSLVFIATDDPVANAAIASNAAARRIPFSRADAPDISDFVNGAAGTIGGTLQDGGGVTIAVSTGKASPVLATRIRDAAIKSIDPVLVEWTTLMTAWRNESIAQVADPIARRNLLLRIAGGEMENILRASGAAAAGETFKSWLASAASKTGDANHGA